MIFSKYVSGKYNKWKRRIKCLKINSESKPFASPYKEVHGIIICYGLLANVERTADNSLKLVLLRSSPLNLLRHSLFLCFSFCFWLQNLLYWIYGFIPKFLITFVEQFSLPVLSYVRPIQTKFFVNLEVIRIFFLTNTYTYISLWLLLYYLN